MYTLLGDDDSGCGGKAAVFLEFSNKTIYLTTTTTNHDDGDDEMRTANYISLLFCIGII